MIKKAEILVVLIVAHGLGTGSLRAEVVTLAPNSNSVVEGGIEYYIQTDKAVYNLGENVEILYRVTNVTENPIYLGEGPSWSYCYRSIVEDDADNGVWQWPGLQLPTMPPIDFVLGAYGSRECERLWNMMNDNGTFELPSDDFPVPSGLYTVTGELYFYSSYEKVPVSVSIEIIPEPSTILLLGLGVLLLKKRTFNDHLSQK